MNEWEEKRLQLISNYFLTIKPFEEEKFRLMLSLSDEYESNIKTEKDDYYKQAASLSYSEYREKIGDICDTYYAKIQPYRLALWAKKQVIEDAFNEKTKEIEATYRKSLNLIFEAEAIDTRMYEL